MARRRHTPEQIVRKLREADKLLNEGKDVTEVARHLEVSEPTYHRWRAQYGGMKADDAKRLRELDARGALGPIGDCESLFQDRCVLLLKRTITMVPRQRTDLRKLHNTTDAD